MREFWLCHELKATRIILTVLIFLFLGMSGVVAQDSAWSFEDNPHPDLLLLSEFEVDFADGMPADLAAVELACGGKLKEEYLKYQRLYPDFKTQEIQFPGSETGKPTCWALQVLHAPH